MGELILATHASCWPRSIGSRRGTRSWSAGRACIAAPERTGRFYMLTFAARPFAGQSMSRGVGGPERQRPTLHVANARAGRHEPIAARSDHPVARDDVGRA